MWWDFKSFIYFLAAIGWLPVFQMKQMRTYQFHNYPPANHLYTGRCRNWRHLHMHLHFDMGYWHIHWYLERKHAYISSVVGEQAKFCVCVFFCVAGCVCVWFFFFIFLHYIPLFFSLFPLELTIQFFPSLKGKKK